MPDAPKTNRFAVTIDELEAQVRVRPEDVVTERPGMVRSDPDTVWELLDRQALRTGIA